MTVMQWLRETFPSVWKTPKPPVILTPWGPVTESARLQCAINMRVDDGVKARVERLCIELMDDNEAAGLAESRRRYPEAYADADDADD